MQWRAQPHQYRDPAEGHLVVGLVLDADTRKPVAAAQVSSGELAKSVVSGPKGVFRAKTFSRDAVLNVIKEGYFSARVNLLGRDSLVVYLQQADKTLRTDRYYSPDGVVRCPTGPARPRPWISRMSTGAISR